MKLIRLARDGRGDGGSFDSGNDNSDTLDRHGNIFYFPAQIKDLENTNETVYIDYQNRLIIQRFCLSILLRRKKWIIPFQDIVMIRPETKGIRQFIFNKNIRLN